ncbi:metalloregulator ArsR/SmtB family transcription factor [Thermatribacter velox]
MKNEVYDLVTIFKALAEPSRIRIVLALSQGEYCICHLTELLQLSPSTVSKHLSILRQAGLIETRKDGKWVRCFLSGNEASPTSREALAWVINFAGKSEQARKDARLLKEICKRSKACENQGKSSVNSKSNLQPTQKEVISDEK